MSIRNLEPARSPSSPPEFPIRVLVVDDSAYLRKIISDMLGRSPRIQVVGVARDGQDALEKIEILNPDVVTLDLFMPELDGVAFLKAQMARRPLPVVVCSIASHDGQAVLAAMEAGAIEFIQKPTALSLDQVYDIAEELIQKVLIAAAVAPAKLPLPQPGQVQGQRLLAHPASGQIEAVVLGVSTGGPQALRSLLPRFPADFPVPLAIVLHMPVGYTGPMAEKLNELSALEVLEARPGLAMQPGRAILAQAGYHLKLQRLYAGVQAYLSINPIQLPHRPSVDVLFRSAAEVYGARTLGVVMTGMGADGTLGAGWIKAQGGQIFTEDESSCIIYGMPRAVVEAGLSDQNVPLDRMAEAILEAI